jgi:hypothetical protein
MPMLAGGAFWDSETEVVVSLIVITFKIPVYEALSYTCD